MEVERILERVGPRKEQIVIDKNFFYCGRMKESDLTCLSLLVSREHCLFTKLSDGLYVTDLGSSNGVFVNGVQIRPKKQFFLKENDYIGIGCADIANLNESMFVYKVKNRIIDSKICDSNSFVSNVQECSRLARKEQSKSRISKENEVLSKIPKTTAEHKLIIGNHNKSYKYLIDDDDDDDIEIIDPNDRQDLIKKPSDIKKEIVDNHSSSLLLNNKYNNVGGETKKITECLDTLNKNNEKSKAKKITPVILSEIIDLGHLRVSEVSKKKIEKMEIDHVPQVHHIKSEPVNTYANDRISVDNNILVNNVNIKQEPQNSIDHIDRINPIDRNDQIDQTCIKEEPDASCFSQIDLVEINDDDESIFPFSQLFDKTVVKEEQENPNLQQSSMFFDDEDDNVITLLDSDDEDIFDMSGSVDAIPRIKTEPELQQPEVTMDINPIPEHAEHMSPDSTNMLSDENMQQSTESEITAASINKSNELSKEPTSTLLHKQPAPQTSMSKDLPPSLSSKIQKKGLEIIEPHFMKPKKKAEKKEKKKPKEDLKKASVKKSSHSSESSKSSSSAKKIGERSFSSALLSLSSISSSKSSSKLKKLKKDKERPGSSKKSSYGTSSSSKDKKSSTVKSKSSSSSSSDKHKSKSEKDKTDNKSNDSTVQLQNASSSKSDPQKQTKPVKNKTTIVKVKVSTKTRGDMLCDSMQTLRPKPKKIIKKTAKPSQKPVAKPSELSTFVIPRRQVPSSSIPASISVLPDIEMNNVPSTSYDKPQKPPTVLSNATNLPSSHSSSVNKNGATKLNHIENPSTEVPLKSSLSIPSLLTTNQKRVSFKENIVSVREFGIEDGKQLKKVQIGSSTSSSSSSSSNTKKELITYKTMDMQIEDFLARVFSWEPVWLEQQQTVKALPPIVKKDDMLQLPNRFNSYDEYYKKMEVLLLLETWQQLLKEYECTGNRYNSSIVLPCMLMRQSIKQMQTPNGLRYSSIVINTLVSKNQMKLQNHPVYGDMIILEYVIKQGTIQKMRRAFAYVVQVHQQSSAKFIKLNPQFCKHISTPDALLTYFLQTRIIDEHTVQFDQIARLRSILYIRSHLRLIQGLQFVPHSALRDSILQVDSDQFQVESVTKHQITNYDLVTKEKLNEKQMEAVIKFTKASVKLEPKIGLLIGPPGTGKSKVIANLVTQILYGDGRYVGGRPLRILVCAPSNAAIDEIVLRLLDIRGAIKEHRFKMVRIGRIESMHEEVKKISVTELAKREAQKIYSEQQHKTSEAVEHKKHKLKNDINALEQLLAGNPHNKVYKRDLEEYRSKFKQLTNTSPEAEAAELTRLQNSAKAVILQKANIIACTLSSCYTSQMETIFGPGSTEKIATCIVDEATQCCEAETLIPLMLGVKNLILVGDPNQLPATVISTDAKKLGLDKSLFTRAKEALESQQNDPAKTLTDSIIMLNVQYRMVNAISYWPNHYFYGGKLVDAVNYKPTFPFQPYRVLNLDGIQDDIKFSNTSEAVFVGNLIYCLMTCGKLSAWNRKITVGIITPYQNQKSLILSTIKEQTRNVSESIKSKFVTEVNTIDSFQGQERDVIIMSCVRSCGIGFLSDQQRLCVALTRAKFTLIICGNFTTFQRDNTWKDLLRDARSRGVVARLNTTAKPHEIKSHVIRLD